MNKLGRGGFYSRCRDCQKALARARHNGTLPEPEKIEYSGELFDARHCKRCDRTLAAHPDFFGRNAKGKGGLHWTCRKCAVVLASRRRETPEGRRVANASLARRYRNDEGYALKVRMGTAIRASLRGSKQFRKWQDLVGYTIGDLKQHLERQFTKGMSWDAYRSGLIHIDHIIPLASFRITSAEDSSFRAAWALTNLRPLWAQENRAKRDRITHLI